MARTIWKETEATVYTCGVQHHADVGKIPTPVTGYSDYLVTFSYEINGEWYSGEFNSPNPREEGSTFLLRYDANNPAINEHNRFDTPKGKVLTWAIGIATAALLIWLKYWWDHPHY